MDELMDRIKANLAALKEEDYIEYPIQQALNLEERKISALERIADALEKGCQRDHIELTGFPRAFFGEEDDD